MKDKTWDELHELFIETLIKKQAYEKDIQDIKAEMERRLKEKKLKSYVGEDYTVSRVIRKKYEVPEPVMRELGLYTEKLDQKKVEKVIKSGVKIEGLEVKETSYITVKDYERRI